MRRRVALVARAALLAGFAGLVASIAGPAAAADVRTGAVGFRTDVAALPGAGGAVDREPLGLWYPTGAAPHPSPVGAITQDVAPDASVAGRGLGLVVFSHGHGGAFWNHADLAFALAQAGFVVAAVTEPGDHGPDGGRAGDESRALDVAGRAGTVDAIARLVVRGQSVPGFGPGVVDPGRVGAFGFSSGGLSVLVASGGVLRTDAVARHCASAPDLAVCRVIATLSAGRGLPAGQVIEDASAGRRGPAIRAIVLAAPALGFAFERADLGRVTMPVQLWAGRDDRIVPEASTLDLAHALPGAPDLHVVPHAMHVDFLLPCPAGLASAAPQMCASEPGFDRAAFHAAFDAAVVAFFEAHLGR